MAFLRDNVVTNLLKNLTGKHKAVSVSTPEELKDDKAIDFIRMHGISMSSLQEMMQQQMAVSYERFSLYTEYDRMLMSPIVSSSLELYAETASQLDITHNKTVWFSAKDKLVERELNRLLDRIAIEEHIFDWAYTTAHYGDLFIKLVSQPGVGIIAVHDSDHPQMIGRIDVNGRLVGFYQTQYGAPVGMENTHELEAPWNYIHMRLVGVKKRRNLYGTDIIAPEPIGAVWLGDKTRRITSKYGTSVLINAITPYKRYRMAEESLMLARLSKSIVRYIYKVKTDSGNPEATNELMQEYKRVLKRARALNTTPGKELLNEATDELGVAEDIILPVWGDVNNVQIDKIGGEADIRWIKDIEEYRNQLAIALRTPLALLGGHVEEATGPLGSSSLEKLDMRFARSARRLQRSVRVGIKTLGLIHMAYQGKNVQPNEIDVMMADLCTAEEEERNAAFDKAADVVQKVSDTIISHTGEDVDKVALLDYLNKKMLKLSDLDLNALVNRTKTMISDKFKSDTALEDKLNECYTSAFAVAVDATPDFSPLALPHKASQQWWDKKYKSLKVTAERAGKVNASSK